MPFKRLGISLVLASVLLMIILLSQAYAKETPFTHPIQITSPLTPFSQPTQTLLSPPFPLTMPHKLPANLMQAQAEELGNADHATSSLYPYNSYGSAGFFFPPYPAESDRTGYGRTSSQDTAILKGGWYVDWQGDYNPDHPGGAVYARTIVFSIHGTGTVCGGAAPAPATSVSQVTASLSGSALINNVQANPGALWLIGNEPDAIFNGSPIHADVYAELYHDYYTTIKAADPTAKVAIGAIVQPSALRMQYLDMILTHYYNKYGQPLPTDLWNIHFYILSETACGWGASVPPGLSGPGWTPTFTPGDLLSTSSNRNNLRTFRQWMYSRGYKETPLIITEYGVLGRTDNGFPYSLTAPFLHDITTIFYTTTDPVTGYSADGNRLVQMWAWFSTYTSHFGGDLFYNGSTTQLTPNGVAFINEIDSHYSPYVDLQPIHPFTVVTNTNDFSLSAYLQNMGNTSASNAKINVALIEVSTGQTAAETTINMGTLQRRYAQPPKAINHTFSVTYTQTPTTTIPYTLALSVASPDAKTNNNSLQQTVMWWPLTDLAVGEIQSSAPNIFVYKEPVTRVVTATVTNIGTQPTPASSFKFTLTKPDNSTVDLTTAQVVPPLSLGGSQTFTATISITQVGAFTVMGTLPDPLGPAEITNNNTSKLDIVAVTPVAYLPLVRR